MILEMLENGRQGVVVRVDGGIGMRDRLLELGIVPGVPVRMIQRAGHGPVLVEVLGTRLMLGHGMAERVVVS